MTKGRIARLVHDRTFGFIKSDGGEEVFFHASAVEGLKFDELETDMKVEFEAEASEKGLRATRVISCKKRVFGAGIFDEPPAR